jgi:hypothetical protein
MKLPFKPGVLAALALAAASTGVIVPALRELVEQAGLGPTAAGLFMSVHVIGGIAGAAWGKRALRLAGSARMLAIAALIASVAVTLAIAAIDSFAIRIGLRIVDGACHLLAITALVAAGTAGDPELRVRRAVALGIAIVLGVVGGLGIGAALGAPELALIVAALLSAGALGTAIAFVAGEPVAPETMAMAMAAAPAGLAADRGLDRRRFAAGLLAFGERFLFGILTVTASYLASQARVGLVLGVFMIASVIAMPLARRHAAAVGPRKLAVRGTLGLTLALCVAAFVDVFASPGVAVVWAIGCGAAAGALYATALVLVARSAALEDRARDMATVQAAGSAGHALGTLGAGVFAAALPGTLAFAVPGIAMILAATLGVWITVPDAARDCPVIGGLASLGEAAPPKLSKLRS